VRDLFTAALAKIGVADVESFLADAERDEGFTWEAKADHAKGRLSPHDLQKTACAFANGRDVGVLIVGAHLGISSWEFPGLVQNYGSLRQWLDDVIRKGLRPVPDYDIRVFQRTSTRGPAALVRIRPVAVKPAVTRWGGIYVRTATSSVPLDDPTEIARLFSAGVAARERAATLTGLAGNQPLEESTEGLGSYAQAFGVALRPVEFDRDVIARIFRQSFVEVELPGTMSTGLNLSARQLVITRVRSDRVTGWVDHEDLRLTFEVLVDGVVRVAAWVGREFGAAEGLALAQRSWADWLNVLGELSCAIGGRGETHVQAIIFTSKRSSNAKIWAAGPQLDESERGRLQRILVRGLGHKEYEPED
jgi:hypothetical protein